MDTVIKVLKFLAVIFALYMTSYYPIKYIPGNATIFYLFAVVILWYFIFNLLRMAGRSIGDNDG